MNSPNDALEKILEQYRQDRNVWDKYGDEDDKTEVDLLEEAVQQITQYIKDNYISKQSVLEAVDFELINEGNMSNETRNYLDQLRSQIKERLELKDE